VERVDAGVLRASDPHGSARGAPAEVPRGLRRAEGYRRRRIEVAELLTSGGSRSNSGHCRRRGRGWRPREASWWGGEPATGLGRGGGAVERPVHGKAKGSMWWSKAVTVLALGGGCGVAC
jgi:hypothetical protein